MKTQIVRVSNSYPDPRTIENAAAMIKRGGLVAFPTETVYGLGANALDSAAVAKIYEAKKRPSDNPVIVHIAAVDAAKKYCVEFFDDAALLASHFWPGPLTLVLKKTGDIPSIVTAGQDTVCLRIPDHPVAMALINASSVPIAAPSANLATRPSPTDAAHVLADLEGRVDLILDAGPVKVGLESTILDLTKKPYQILRPGAVSAEMLKSVLGQRTIAYQSSSTIRTPGNRYKHYAPDCEIWLFVGEPENVEARIKTEYTQLIRAGKRVRIVTLLFAADESVTSVHRYSSLADFGYALFREFRQAEKDKVDVLLIEKPAPGGIGRALQNRLEKAATRTIICA